MALLTEQVTPGWLPVVILLVPIMIILLAVIAGVRYRARARLLKRAEAPRRAAAAATGVGAEAAIEDPSGYSWEAMLEALALEPEDDGPAPEGQPSDDAYFATMLGLQASLVSSGSGEGVLRPNVLWGSRPLGQVFIRSGPDERAEGLQVATGRHWRHITVLRVDAPDFELRSEHGELHWSFTTPSAVRELISSLRPDETVWHRLFLAAGPKGIVASRPAVDPLAVGWIYDLWLCERIAQLLRLSRLPDAELGTRWRIPYNLGRKLTSTAA